MVFNGACGAGFAVKDPLVPDAPDSDLSGAGYAQRWRKNTR